MHSIPRCCRRLCSASPHRMLRAPGYPAPDPGSVPAQSSCPGGRYHWYPGSGVPSPGTRQHRRLRETSLHPASRQPGRHRLSTGSRHRQTADDGCCSRCRRTDSRHSRDRRRRGGGRLFLSETDWRTGDQIRIDRNPDCRGRVFVRSARPDLPRPASGCGCWPDCPRWPHLPSKVKAR